MIHLDLQPEIEVQIAAESRSRGLSLHKYNKQIIAARPQYPAETVAEILSYREGIGLDGLKTEDLIREGRK